MELRSLGVAVLAALAGCSAAKTTFVDTDSQGHFIENPAGCIPGIPSVVRVATHIEVAIIQTDFWRVERDATDPESKKKLVHLPSATLRTVGVEQVMTDKMVMLDPKRPASGEGQFSVAYQTDGSGRILSVNYKAVDETIKDSAALVSAALKVFGAKLTDAKSVGGRGSNILKVSRVVALQRFPVGQCTTEEMQHFVDQYINGCTPVDCNSPPDYALPSDYGSTP